MSLLPESFAVWATYQLSSALGIYVERHVYGHLYGLLHDQ
jgi:hypothetical protein